MKIKRQTQGGRLRPHRPQAYDDAVTPLQAKLLEALREATEPQNANALGRLLGCTSNRAATALKKLQQAGRVRSTVVHRGHRCYTWWRLA